jgi:hypothetical protein
MAQIRQISKKNSVDRQIFIVSSIRWPKIYKNLNFFPISILVHVAKFG